MQNPLHRTRSARFSAALVSGITALATAFTSSPVQAVVAARTPLTNIDHIIVIYQENWTFDGLYGSFPGANGVANASPASITQIDRLNGNSLANEITNAPGSYNNPAFVPSSSTNGAQAAQTTNPPPPLTTDAAAGVADSRFPTNFNTLQPYLIPSVAPSADPTTTTGDIYHRYWQEQFQIAGAINNNGAVSRVGHNSGFVSWSDNPGLVMSRYDATNLAEGLLAQQYTICDNFFHSAFGGSFLNHQWLIAAATPVYYNMPTSNNGNIAYLDPNGLFVLNTSGAAAGKYVRDGSITPISGDVLSNLTYNGTSGLSETVGTAS
ncbi:MAG: hypothetical protein JO295_12805, partial [Verrucomicrobia bacterium]|nr:hypothetical protein [Verrucomicrobiota bacterium]